MAYVSDPLQDMSCMRASLGNEGMTASACFRDMLGHSFVYVQRVIRPGLTLSIANPTNRELPYMQFSL